MRAPLVGGRVEKAIVEGLEEYLRGRGARWSTASSTADAPSRSPAAGQRCSPAGLALGEEVEELAGLHRDEDALGRGREAVAGVAGALGEDLAALHADQPALDAQRRSAAAWATRSGP